jgi:general stress protein 26
MHGVGCKGIQSLIHIPAYTSVPTSPFRYCRWSDTQ